jgi:hypothetical protein
MGTYYEAQHQVTVSIFLLLVLGENITKTLFSNTLSPCHSLRVTHQPTEPYKTAEIMQFYTVQYPGYAEHGKTKDN